MKKLMIFLISLSLLFVIACSKDKTDDKVTDETNNEMTDEKTTEEETTTDEKDTEETTTDEKDTEEKDENNDMTEDNEEFEIVANDGRYADEFTEKEHGDTIEEGKPAIDFTVKNLDGEEVKLDQFLESGEHILVNFFKTTWPYCVKEMPDLVELDKRSDLKVIFVNLGESPKLLKQFLTMNKIDIPVFFDEEANVAKAYGVTGIPHSELIAGDGTVKATIKGALPLEQLTQIIDDKIGENSDK